MERTVIFKAYYWNYEETEDNNLLIHIGGRTAPDKSGETKSVHCIVQNFTPFVYLELPKRIKWNKAKCIAVFEYFQKIMKSDGPCSYSMLSKYKLNYKEIFNCLWLTFKTNKSLHMFCRRCHNARSGLFIEGVGNFRSKEFIVHEANLDPLIKFSASKKLKLASWIAATETIKPGEEELDLEDRKFSTADIDLYADWKFVENYDQPGVVIVNPVYVSFDIECYSKNHNSKLSDPKTPENCVFQIGNTVGTIGNPKRRKVLFTLGNPHNQKDYETIKCNTEKELLLKWKCFVEKENPDCLIGYNTMKFDWNYMIERSEFLGIYMKFAQMTRVIGKRADSKETSWSSSAYGEQKFRYLDPVGRTNVDVLLEVERNYRLPQYGLNAVSEYFLKEHKDDISARQLFMLYQLTMELSPIVEALVRGVVPRNERIEIKKKIQEILEIRRCTGVVRKLRMALINAKTGADFEKYVRDAFTLTGKYCIQDTVLPVALCEKLNLWTTMEETSNCVNTPMSYLHTRGQQVKVLSQVYWQTIFNDIVIPFREKLKDGEAVKYEGAMVVDAFPGDYDNVLCFDFESLYPSIMIAKNICHTTHVRDDDPYPRDKCHIIKISSHVGCSHDLKKRKRKKEDIMCKEVTHTFKKVITHPDGTRENEGIMAGLVRKLLSERKIIKKEMAKAEARFKMAKGLAEPEDIKYYQKLGWPIIKKGSLTNQELETLEVEIKVLNARQLAIKIAGNSAYGGMGAQNGPIPLVEGAESVTGIGRDLIVSAIDYILKKNPGAVAVGEKSHVEPHGKAKLVYGDSVTPDTPILIQITSEKDTILTYVNIEDIPRKTSWYDIGEKEYAIPKNDVKVWSDQGFTRIKEIIRHKTNKNIYRVLTRTGCVEVTEDHSLLTPKGEEIRPIDVKVGDSLMHCDFPKSNTEITNKSVFQMCPYSAGVFFGSGCIHKNLIYCKPWLINSSSLETLNKVKKELENFYTTFKFSIIGENSYKLIRSEDTNISFFYTWFEFYNTRHQKIIPVEILNASNETIRQFIEGYENSNPVASAEIGATGFAALYYLYEKIGKPVNIKDGVYKFLEPSSESKSIKKIWDLGPSNDYVYDLETENHHFGAGVGKLIVHNTDSSMITFVGKTTEESFLLGDKISKETTHYLKSQLLGFDEEYKILCPSEKVEYRLDKYPRDKIKELSDELKIQIYEYDANPINLQFENLYKRYLLLSKKRYLATAVNRKGEIIAKIKKGVVLARRDNCQYLRDTYSKMVDAIIERNQESDVMGILYDQIQKLFSRQIPDANLIIYTGVKTIMNYAKKKEKKQGRTVIDRTFLDCEGQPIDDPFGPMDPRLVYPNLPQVLLALKMMRRGDDVPPNTRLEYLYLEKMGAEHQGEKAEDFTFYKENKDIYKFKPDYIHYIQKQLSKPIMELLEVKYPRARVPYEKLEDALDRHLGSLNDLIKHRVEQIKVYEKKIEDCPEKEKIGWHALCNACKSKTPKMCSKHNPKTKAKIYKYKGKYAKVQFILDSAATKKKNPKKPNEIDEKKYPDLIDICRKWKARHILDMLYSNFRVRKRTAKRPTQTGEKLRIKKKDEYVQVLLTQDLCKKAPHGKRKGDLVTLKAVREEFYKGIGAPAKGKKICFYTIETNNKEIIENVPRNAITTWYYKDGTVMKDILLARGSYNCVVRELKKTFDPLVFGNEYVPEFFDVSDESE